MPSNYTSNYHLNQWAKSDQVRMEDFNADNAKIDAALKELTFGNCHIETGSYVGTGSYGNTEEAATTLTLGYPPKVVFVSDETGLNAGLFCRPCTRAYLHNYYYNNYVALQWRDDGIAWWIYGTGDHKAENQLNKSGTTYHYVVLS